MKLCFSTLACPDWSFEEIASIAKELGFSAIELRGLQGELYAPDIWGNDREKIMATRRYLRSIRMPIACLSSHCYLHEGHRYLKEAKEYIDLAHDLKVPFVRLLGDRNPEPGERVDTEVAKELLKALDEYASKTDVTPLLETNGIFANSLLVKTLFSECNLKHCGVLWDIQHPYLYYREDPFYTVSNLKELIRFVHVKDSVVSLNQVVYRPVGEGKLPILQCLKALNEIGYKGYFSLEWVKRWHPELSEPREVLIGYQQYMKQKH